MRWRPALSLGVIAALAVGVWAALSSGDEEAPASTTTTTTTPATSTSLATTTTAAPPTTDTTVGTTSSTAAPDTTISSEARLEEVRLILEDLWFRWFDAIYRNDEDAVRAVIATEAGLEDFREAVTSVAYAGSPSRGDVLVEHPEILRDDEQCLVVYSTLNVSGFVEEPGTSAGVDVLWPHEAGWRRATRWGNRGDIWEQDCDAQSGQLP
jgi:hypothetical protein